MPDTPHRSELAAALIDHGDLEEASAVLQLAAATASGADAVRVSNNLGVVAALKGDRATADAHYRSALTAAERATGLDAEGRALQTNLANLAMK